MKILKRKTRKPLWLVKQIRMGTFAVISHQLETLFVKFGISAEELSQSLNKFNQVLRRHLEEKGVKYE